MNYLGRLRSHTPRDQVPTGAEVSPVASLPEQPGLTRINLRNTETRAIFNTIAPGDFLPKYQSPSGFLFCFQYDGISAPSRRTEKEITTLIPKMMSVITLTCTFMVKIQVKGRGTA